MKQQTTESEYTGSSDTLRPVNLQGLTLPVARAAWVSVVVMAVAIFAFAVPAEFGYLQTTCAECDGPRLTTERARELEEIGLSIRLYATYTLALEVVFAAVSLAVAALIFWRKSDERTALLGAFAVVVWGITFPNTTLALAESYPAAEPPVALLGLLGMAAFTLFFYMFPDGRFVPRWTRWLALALISLVAPSYFFPESPASVGAWPVALQLSYYLIWMGSLLAVQVYRYRSVSCPAERQQTKWVVFGFATAVVGFLVAISVYPFLEQPGPLAYLAGNTGIYLSMLMIPLSISVAILRYRLFDIDLVINRALVYGALTACVVGLYVLVVGYLGTVFRTGGNLAFSLIATGVVAVLFAPLRDRLQRAVNRLMYGERDDPYAVVSRLGERLESTLVPEAVLPTIVETVKEALRLPYAAIALRKGGEVTGVAAATGEPVDEPLCLPLLYRNEPVGELLLAPRVGEGEFSAADRRLLEDLARQAGVAAHAVRLTEDLQSSRERLVTTREEERRRLRRDLHDGLGAQLAGLNIQTGVLRGLIQRDPEAADALAVELREELRSAITDIRRLVHGLRPPALDELGLAGAVRRLAERYGAEEAGLRVSVTAEELPPLPAAVEVAVYRIVQEALTNIVRHARADECTVSLAAADEELSLEITDDGTGLPEGLAVGVGLLSMRERAAELGGECAVDPATGGGTRVRVWLPLSRGE